MGGQFSIIGVYIGRYYPQIQCGIFPEFAGLVNTPNIGRYYPMIQRRNPTINPRIWIRRPKSGYVIRGLKAEFRPDPADLLRTSNIECGFGGGGAQYWAVSSTANTALYCPRIGEFYPPKENPILAVCVPLILRRARSQASNARAISDSTSFSPWNRVWSLVF